MSRVIRNGKLVEPDDSRSVLDAIDKQRFFGTNYLRRRQQRKKDRKLEGKRD